MFTLSVASVVINSSTNGLVTANGVELSTTCAQTTLVVSSRMGNFVLKIFFIPSFKNAA